MCAVVLTPTLLYAHARLVRSTPAADSTLAAPPPSLTLWFSEKPELRFTTLRLLDSAGAPMPLGPVAAPIGEAMAIAAPVAGSLANGKYTVVWRTAAADGHATAGRFSFVVAGPAAATVARDTAMRRPRPVTNAVIEPAPRTGVSTAMRWAELVAVLTLVGVLVFRLFVLPGSRVPADVARDAVDRARRLAGALLVLVAVTTATRLFAEADLVPTAATARMAAMLSVVRGTAWGHGWSIGAAGVVLMAIGLVMARASEGGWSVAALGAVAIAFGEGLTGHAGALARHASLATALDLAHVLGAGGWLGGLAALVLCGLPAARRPGGNAAGLSHHLVRAFHRSAVECVTIVVLTALAASWLRLGALSDLWMTQYGRTLLLKMTLVLGLFGFGFYHWRSAVLPDWDDDTGFRFRRSAAVELLLGACVVAVTAVLISTALPGT